MTGRNRGIESKRFLRFLASAVLLALAVPSLTGCYAFEGVIKITETGINEASVEVDIFQGVESNLFNTPTDALDFVNTRFGAEWESSEEFFTPDFAVVGLNAVETTPASFADLVGNEITIDFVPKEVSPDFVAEYLITITLEFPEIPAGSDVQASGGFRIVGPPFSDLVVRQAGGAQISSFDSDWTVLWNDPVAGVATTILALQPLYAPSEADTRAGDPQPIEPDDSRAGDPQLIEPDDSEVSSQEIDEEDSAPSRSEEELSLLGDERVESGTDDRPRLPLTAGGQDLSGQVGRATTAISGDPGLIQIGSELVQAVSLNNELIPAGSRVRVIGAFSEGVLVERIETSDRSGAGWIIGGALIGIAVVGSGLIILRLRKNSVAAEGSN